MQFAANRLFIHISTRIGGGIRPVLRRLLGILRDPDNSSQVVLTTIIGTLNPSLEMTGGSTLNVAAALAEQTSGREMQGQG
jgi:hypothetical protein